MCKFVVIEYLKRQSNIILLGESSAATPKPCWNFLYSVEFNPMDEIECSLAFNGCEAWIENNKVDGSSYVIQEMFFYTQMKLNS